MNFIVDWIIWLIVLYDNIYITKRAHARLLIAHLANIKILITKCTCGNPLKMSRTSSIVNVIDKSKMNVKARPDPLEEILLSQIYFWNNFSKNHVQQQQKKNTYSKTKMLKLCEKVSEKIVASVFRNLWTGIQTL